MDCIFCKIVSGDIPSYKVYEDEDIIAILDISQATKGHALVISKLHLKNLYELDETLSSKIFKVVPKLARAIKKAFNPIGLNVLVNVDKPLQTVMHFHIHIIPRYEDDGMKIEFTDNHVQTTASMYEDIKQKIIEQI